MSKIDKQFDLISEFQRIIDDLFKLVIKYSNNNDNIVKDNVIDIYLPSDIRVKASKTTDDECAIYSIYHDNELILADYCDVEDFKKKMSELIDRLWKKEN